MDREELYEKIAERKDDPNHILPYKGGNGRIDRFLNMVRDGTLKAGGTVLDVGGSHGDLVWAALSEGLFNDGHVTDISFDSVKKAQKRGLKAYCGDVDVDGLQGRDEFDCIVALDFIEHIVDPENFARECYKALRPGGYVFINTPNISYWRHLESLVCNGVFPHTSGDSEVYHGGHLAFYNENDMQKIFRAAGFSGTATTHNDENYDPPSNPLWRNLLREKGAKADSMLSNPNLIWSIEKNK